MFSGLESVSIRQHPLSTSRKSYHWTIQVSITLSTDLLIDLTGRPIKHILINPDEDTEFNLRSGFLAENVALLHLKEASCHVLQALVNKLTR